MELKVFTDVFGSVKTKYEIVIPAVISVIVALILNMVILETINPDFSWIPFAFEVFKWSMAFTLSGLTALIVRFDGQDMQRETFSRSLLNLFVFSVFMAFFVVIGYEIYMLPGMLVLFFTMYAPVRMTHGNDFDILRGLKDNLAFILDDTHILHTFVILLILSLLIIIPYVGDYLSLFFYTLWVPYVYENLRLKREEEFQENFE